MSAATDTRQISLLPPDAATLLHLVRENLRLLAELAGRYEVSGLSPMLDRPTVHKPADVAAYLSAEMAPLAQEQLLAVLLDSRNHVIGSALVYQGGLNATVIRLGDCFRDAVANGAAAVVLVHNHPSGDPTPSPEDVRLTAEAAQAGDLLGVQLLDHIVIGQSGHVSLRQLGLYSPTAPPDA